MTEKKPTSEDRLQPPNATRDADAPTPEGKARGGRGEAIAVRTDVPPTRGRAAGPVRAGRRDTAIRPLLGIASPAAVRTDNLLVVLWRSRWLVVLCLLVALNLGTAYLRTATPLYTSTAKLYLDYAGVRISNPYDPVGRPQTDKYLSTQVEIIKSRPVLAAVENILVSQPLRTLADAATPTAFLRKNLVVEIGKKDEVISISLRSPYPTEAAEIVNYVVDAYRKSRSEQGQRDSAQVLKALEDALERAGRELDEKQEQLTDFQTNKMPLALGSDQSSGVTQRYQELQNKLTQAQIRKMDAEDFRRSVQILAQNPIGLRQYLQLRGNTSVYASADQEKTLLAAKAVELKHQRENLLKQLTMDHPDVVALNAEVNRIEAKVKELDDKLAKAVVAAAEQQYVEAKNEEEQVARLFEGQQKQVVMLNAEVRQYQNLRSEVERLRTYSQNLDQEVRDFRKIVGEDVGQLRMAVLEPAVPAAVPSDPQKARTMAMALIVGLLLGGGVAVTRDWLDQTLRSTDEISTLLGVPVLGAVPAMSRHKRMQERGRRVFLHPDSHEAEAFRTIRTAVLFSTSNRDVKTLLITSPAVGDGKSTLVSNLGIALAGAGQKTLILDADFRKPTQHQIFGLDPRERCLSDVFEGTMTLAAAVQPTGVEGLHVLSGGYRIANPAEVLHSQSFSDLLTCLTEVYDRIVIDAPPVAVVTDAQILGARCDATVLVLRADKSVRKVARHAIDSLQSVGAHLLGVVVNEVHRSGDRYGYYHHRYRKYYGAAPNNGRIGKSSRRIPVGSESGALPARIISRGT